MNADAIKDFMSRVVPWPTNDGPGYINVHWHLPGKPFRGRAVRNIDEFFVTAEALAESTPSNLYFCLSRQAEAKAVNGHLEAERTKQNALDLKSIWLDIDVKSTNTKCYHSFEEAFDALTRFIDHYKLPPPSALVISGNGLHVYWISDRPLPYTEWLPYAEGLKAAALTWGLKCDAGITADAARVLRIPGTKNFKTDPPRPVTLKSLQEKDYDFAAILTTLRGMAPPPRATSGRGAPFGGQKMAAAFAHLDPSESLSLGIEREEMPPLQLEPLMKECAFIREAIETGGKDFSQTQWMYTTLISTWLEDGDALAHRMGNRHPGYTPETTEELLERKKRDRKEKNVGWPSCRVIRDAGCKHCKECPHFNKGKSPLHLALPTATSDLDSSFSQVKESDLNPIATLMTLRDQGADIKELLLAMNRAFAVVKYGSKIMIATIIGKELDFMKLDDFHNMLANLAVQKKIELKDDAGAPQETTQTIIVSKYWFKWKDRRQYVGRGVVFEPGGPLEIPNGMLNLWRGFGVEPKQGDWSLLRNHIRDVICSGNEEHFQYTIRWMAYGVQHPHRPIGVAIALRGEEGAGKGFLWRNYGKLFGKHFKHIAHGEHLTGRFNAALAEALAVFLDEALWAGDRKGEQILKALVTEDTFQLERKFCDPIPVKNRLRIVIASNNQWIVPVSTRGRRYFVLDVSDLYADENDPAHAAYWEPLQAQFGDYAPDDGRAAMLYELLHMDLSGFNVRAAPQSAAKTEQKLLTQTGTEAWLFEILEDGAVTKSSHGSRYSMSKWGANGMQISVDDAYDAFLQFSQERREYKPRSKQWWSRDVRKILKECVSDGRPRIDNPDRKRLLTFRSLNECRKAYGEFVGADDIGWEPLHEPDTDTARINSAADAHIDREHDETDTDLDTGWEHDETEPEADIGWEHDETDTDPDIGREHDETDADAGIDWEPIDEPDTADESDADVVQVMPGPL